MKTDSTALSASRFPATTVSRNTKARRWLRRTAITAWISLLLACLLCLLLPIAVPRLPDPQTAGLLVHTLGLQLFALTAGSLLAAPLALGMALRDSVTTASGRPLASGWAGRLTAAIPPAVWAVAAVFLTGSRFSLYTASLLAFLLLYPRLLAADRRVLSAIPPDWLPAALATGVSRAKYTRELLLPAMARRLVSANLSAAAALAGTAAPWVLAGSIQGGGLNYLGYYQLSQPLSARSGPGLWSVFIMCALVSTLHLASWLSRRLRPKEKQRT